MGADELAGAIIYPTTRLQNSNNPFDRLVAEYDRWPDVIIVSGMT